MKRTLIALPLITLLATPALADDTNRGPQMPVDEIAKTLGISATALDTCFKNNRPERPQNGQQGERPQGQPPQGEPPKGEKGQGAPTPPAELISCLQGHNAKITADSFTAAMDAHRPQPPKN